VPTNSKEYYKEYQTRPGVKEKQHKAQKAYRDRIKSTPEGLARWAKKAREYRASEGGKRKARNRLLRYHYGITLEEYESMSARQDHACAICGSEASLEQYGVLHVDHDHTTGAVRELLCSMCNTGLGVLRDSPRLAELCAAYLRKHGRT
jgi:hypothetical protein